MAPAQGATQAATLPSQGYQLPGATARDKYNHAFSLLRQANYGEAELALRAFLAEHAMRQYWPSFEQIILFWEAVALNAGQITERFRTLEAEGFFRNIAGMVVGRHAHRAPRVDECSHPRGEKVG